MARNSILLIFAFLITGCAPKVVGIYNDSAFKKNQRTFIVLNPKRDNSLPGEKKLLDDRLNDIITTSLENKGLKTSSLPDLYVSYMASVYNTSETTSNNNNYNNPYSRNNYMYQSPYDYSTTSYKTGVFIIDIKNSQNKLVWQGSKTFKLKSKQSVQATLPEICREVIMAFDINYNK
jgi:hypothetical protein